jgi:hypothetical protein
MNLCKLHYGLHLLANREGVILEKFETIAAKVFPDQKLNIAPLLTVLEKCGILQLEGNPLHIRLNQWPEMGHRQIASKADCFQAAHHGSGDPETKESAPRKTPQEVNQYEMRLKKAGLTGFTRSPAFSVFLEAWPNPITDKKATTTAGQEWDKLERAKKLPDISLLLVALKKSPPPPRTWPSTWLKKHPWYQTTRLPDCPTCNDEGLVYGVTPEGKKGAMPCPKCQPS